MTATSWRSSRAADFSQLPPVILGGSGRRSAIWARAARALTLLSMAMLFGMSSMLLYQLGYNYEMPGGTLLEKMHPGTLVAFAAASAMIMGRPRPFVFAGELIARRPGIAAFLFIWCALLAYLALAQKSPFTAIVDTYLLPMVMLTLIDEQRSALARPVELFLHAFLAVNCIIGSIEVASGWRLVPYVIGGVTMTDDWRATAFMGHPLANACVIGAYLLTLLLRGGAMLQGIWRVGAIVLASAGMVAFGGRAALVLLLLFAAPLAFLRLTTGLAFGRATPLQAATMTLALLTAPLAIMLLADLGAFDQFISRFVDDQGSAKSRVAMFHLFDDLSWREVLLGPDPNLVETLKQIEGLEFGIESFWVSSALAFGLAMAMLLFLGLFFYCCEIVRASRRSAWVLLAYFFAVASTSVSLSAKTCILMMITTMAMVLLPPRETTPIGHRSRSNR